MKPNFWLSALKAHARSHCDAGEYIRVSVGECAAIMGCTPQTARKHLSKAWDDGLVKRVDVEYRGAVKRTMYEWTV